MQRKQRTARAQQSSTTASCVLHGVHLDGTWAAFSLLHALALPGRLVT